MTRLTSLTKDQLDEQGAALWDAILGPRGDSLVNDEGGLHGPFNAWLHAPTIGKNLSRLGASLRFEMDLDRRLIELAIITVGARWKSEFEWYAHSTMALDAGVTAATVDAIGAGETPTFDRDDERIVYELAYQLVRDGRLDPEIYQAAADLLGQQQMVELVSLCGYYCLISLTLNAFAVPLPNGVERRWPDA
ncbi:MAG: carboxymuconolactone decarboxylase family protein [Acidimicrobiales bacterium]